MKQGAIMELKGVTILIAGKPTKSGKVYTKKAIQSILNSPMWKEKEQNGSNYFVMYTEDPDYLIGTHNTCGVVYNSRLENNKLVVDVDVLDVPNGRIFKTFVDNGVTSHFKIIGDEKVNRSGKVDAVKPYYVTTTLFSLYEEEYWVA